MAQTLGGIHLGEKLGFKVHAGGEAGVGVGGPGIAIGAAMLAAAVGIDRAVEGNVRRVVPGDDGLHDLGENLGLERRQRFERVPSVVEQVSAVLLEPARPIGSCTATALMR